jgi:hypothetical protein
MTGIDVSGRVIILHDLQAELIAGGVPVPYGLGILGPSVPPVLPPPIPPDPTLPQGSVLFTYDAQGAYVELPPEAEPIVAAYVPTIPLTQAQKLAALQVANTAQEVRDAVLALLA